jgi:hypothetical protein
LALVALAAALAVPRAAGTAPRRDQPIQPRVLVLLFNPVIRAEGGTRLSEVCRWNDPNALTQAYIQDVREASGGFVQYQVVETHLVDAFPPKKDGFSYTESGYLECFRKDRGWHLPDAADYPAVFSRFDVVRRINRHEIDEVWVWAMPHAGFYESTMAGKEAYFCNSGPLTEVDSDRAFVVMGFNYAQGAGEMLENLGHRTESIMRRVYGSWSPERTHAWNRFTLYDKVAPGDAACGNVHFAPNSARDYEWGSRKPVLSSADDWLNYPHLTGRKRLMTCADWGNGDSRAYHKWWLSHLPRTAGRAPDGKLANWWKYVVDFHRYEESR